MASAADVHRATQETLASDDVAAAEAKLAAVYARNLRSVARMAAAGIHEHATPLVAAAEQPRFVLPHLDEILDPTRTQDTLARGTAAPRVAVAEAAYGGVHQTLGLSYDIQNPLMQGVLDKLGQKITNISEDVRQDVMGELNQAYEQGESIDQAAARVQRSISDASELRGRTIARTEVIGATNGASLAAVRNVDGARYKTWIATMDDRTRETHAEAHGQVVPIQETFSVGDDQLDYPGDPTGSAEEVINCRCTIGYADDPADVILGGGAMPPPARAELTPQMRRRLEQMLPAQRAPFLRSLALAEPLAIPASANYRAAAADAAQTCGNCSHYDNGQCTLYDAAVDAAYTCDSWEAIPAADGQSVRWRATLAVEGVATEDGRMLAVDGGTWRDPPLPLMALTETSDGWNPHAGAKLAGRMDVVARDPADARLITAEGVFDSGEWGAEVARQVGEGFLTGVSIDPTVDAVEWVLWDNQTGAPVDEDTVDEAEVEKAFWGESQLYRYVAVFVAYTIIGATVCPMPAIEATSIALVTDAEPVAISAALSEGKPARLRLVGRIELAEPLTASALLPSTETPPGAWFDNPQLDHPTPLTVTDEGRVYGHIAAWGTCHIGRTEACMEPPRSRTEYGFFLLGEIVTSDGPRACGQLTIETGHASLALAAAPATKHYDDTGTAAADVAAGEDEHGIWIAGAVRPDLDARKLAALRACKPSGDWRPVGRSLELVGILGVNVPGFPIPRVRQDAAGRRLALVAGLAPPVPASTQRTLDALARRAQGRTVAVAALAERVL